MSDIKPLSRLFSELTTTCSQCKKPLVFNKSDENNTLYSCPACNRIISIQNKVILGNKIGENQNER